MIDWSAPVAAPGDVVVHRSPERRRLEGLAKEHERLLREVAKARAALLLAEEVAREVAETFDVRLRPLRERLLVIARELHASFEALLGAESFLGKRDKVKVRRVRGELFAVFPEELVELPAATGDAEERTRGSPGGEGRSGRDRVPADEPRDAGYSAGRPDARQGATLRAVLRRLVSALHPDKAEDTDEKARRTSVMKEVTRAYEAGDVARLVELERALLAAAPLAEDPGAFVRRAEELVAANVELRRQLRRLTADRKEVIRSVPFRPRRGDPEATRRAAAEELADAVAGAEREVAGFARVRDFVRRFADGKMGIDEFVAGPPPRHSGAIIADFAGAVLEELCCEPSPRPSPKRGRKR